MLCCVIRTVTPVSGQTLAPCIAGRYDLVFFQEEAMTRKWTHTDYVLKRMPRKGFDRKYRLFAVACYRICLAMFDSHEHYLEMAERYAEGEVAAEKMLELPHVPSDPQCGLPMITHPQFSGFEAAWFAAGFVMACSPEECRIPDKQRRCDVMCDLLRDIFGTIPELDEMKE